MLRATKLLRTPTAVHPWPTLALHRALHSSPVPLAHRPSSSPSRPCSLPLPQTDSGPPPIDFFDSADYVHRFEQQGLTRQQAEGIVDALENIVQESVNNLESNLVSRTEHYKVRPLGALSRSRLSPRELTPPPRPPRPQHHDRQKVRPLAPSAPSEITELTRTPSCRSTLPLSSRTSSCRSAPTS